MFLYLHVLKEVICFVSCSSSFALAVARISYGGLVQ